MLYDQDNKVSTITSNIEVPLKTHREYIAYHDKVDTGSLDADAVIKESGILLSGAVSVLEKRRILFSLAHVGTLEAINVLRRYLASPDQELAAWAMLCFNECRMRVKSEELGEDHDLVMTGTGGEGNRLRYYVVVSAEGNRQFSVEQQQRVRAAFKAVGNALESKVESIEFGSSHAFISALIPFDIAPADFIEGGIKESNKGIRFLRFHYYVTNVRKPTVKEIASYLKGLRKE